MNSITRRRAIALLTALAILPSGVALAVGGRADGRPKEFRIGFQKIGVLVVARQRRAIERRLGGLGIAVKWVEFASGPPLLKALDAGRIDFGFTGDTPPIFAQAAGARLVYVAALPSNGAGEAVIVRSDGPIRALADLRGKRIAFTAGSSASNLTIVALEKAGLGLGDVTPVHLDPAAARAAFAAGSIDAWTIWDPFLAMAQQRFRPRVLVTSADILQVNTFFIANRGFAARHPSVLVEVLDALAEAARWAEANHDKVARALAEVTGIGLAAQTVAAGRAHFAVFPLDDAIVARQQATADRLFRLGLIPAAIAIRDAAWSPPRN
ncbi:MAG: aliphatic sulfonate ABC transporter substrate-binding protein [Alphaproteobacteria bacterium]|nr:aliphatic sulfonate ABC transporter substrate-binding protein [Alphaproteobacteria bacterium]